MTAAAVSREAWEFAETLRAAIEACAPRRLSVCYMSQATRHDPMCPEHGEFRPVGRHRMLSHGVPDRAPQIVLRYIQQHPVRRSFFAPKHSYDLPAGPPGTTGTADGGDTPPLVASVNAPELPAADSFLADVAVAGRGAAPDRCNESGAANKGAQR